MEDTAIEILPDETKEHYDAFVMYRNLGATRNLQLVASEVGKPLNTVGLWSSRYQWVARTRAWEREQANMELLIERQELKKMHRRHIKMALAMQEAAMAEILKIVDKTKYEEQTLDPKLALKLAEVGASLERLTRGQPNEITDVKVQSIDYTKLSLEELKQLREVKKKLSDGG